MHNSRLKLLGYLLVALLLALLVLQPDGGDWIWLAFLPVLAGYGMIAVWLVWRFGPGRRAALLWPWALGWKPKKLP